MTDLRDEFFNTHDLYASGDDLEMARDENGRLRARVVQPTAEEIVGLRAPMRQAQSPYATGERDPSEIPADIARTVGALGKGAAVGTVGAAGDIAGLARGIGAAIGAEEGERLDAFTRGFDEISQKYGTGAVNEFANLLGDTLGLRLTPEGDEYAAEMVEQGQLAGEFLGLAPAAKAGKAVAGEAARMQRGPYAQMGAAGDLADVIRQKIVPGKKLFAQPEEVRRFFAENEGLEFTQRFVSEAKTMDTYPPGADASTMMTGDDLLKFFGDNADDGDDLRRVLDIRAAEMEKKPQDRIQPSGQDPLFDTSPEAYQADLPEQRDTPVPRAPEGKKLPKGDRAAPVSAMQAEIADVLAERMRPHLGTAAQYFYNTGPIIRKAISLGIPEEQAREQLKKFALNYAATSPRTMTEQNLRNASLVSAKEARDIPLTEVVGPGGTGINEKGYPMMIGPSGIHRLLVDAKNAEGISYNTNPKPATFAENVMGNLQGVTVDTHAIRGALDAMNEVKPGSIPDGFIKAEFRDQYKADPSSLDPAKMIDDTLGDQKVDGEKMQTEYAVFSDLYKAAAERVGVSPAEAQSLGWFGSGDKTGLASDLKTVVDLLDERIDVTAQALNRPKEKVFVDFMSGKIPLLSFGGMTLLETGSMMEEENNGNL